MQREHIAFRLALPLFVGATITACASSPDTRPERNDLESRADDTLTEMVERDPSLEGVVDGAAGYVVFPEVREGAALVGGGSGLGVAYMNGDPVGTVVLREGSFGAQVGGQVYSQLIVFRSEDAFTRLRHDRFQLTADASATIVRRGAAASAASDNDVVVFITGETGAMVEASVGGQSLDFEPNG